MPKSTKPRKPAKSAARKQAPLLASLPATLSRKPLDATGCVELTLPMWVALDRLAEGVPLGTDFQTLLYAMRVCLLLKEYGVDVPKSDLVLLNDAAAVIASLRERIEQAGRYWLEGDEKTPLTIMLTIAGGLIATAPAVLVVTATQHLLALESGEAATPPVTSCGQ